MTDKEKLEEAIKTLHHIASKEIRADRRHRNMIDVSIVSDIKRIARNTLDIITRD